MPIGFWAVSRDEVRIAYETLAGEEPTRGELDKIVETLRGKLNETLDDTLHHFTSWSIAK